jgi:hypothetical protein
MGGGAITPRSCDAQLTGRNSTGAQLVVRGGVAASGDGLLIFGLAA